MSKELSIYSHVSLFPPIQQLTASLPPSRIPLLMLSPRELQCAVGRWKGRISIQMVARRVCEKRRRLDKEKEEEEEKENLVRRFEGEERVQGGGDEGEEEERKREEREYGRLQGLLPHYRWKNFREYSRL